MEKMKKAMAMMHEAMGMMNEYCNNVGYGELGEKDQEEQGEDVGNQGYSKLPSELEPDMKKKMFAASMKKKMG